MTRSVDERLQDILDAIQHARTADERLQVASRQGDSVGEQIAFDAILHNLFVMGEAVKALPPDLLDRAPHTPWSEIASIRDVIGHHYHRVVPAIIHGTGTHDLGPLEVAVIRLRDGR